MSSTKAIAVSVVLTALAVALSPIFIPVGIAKCFPAQHLVNVLAAVLVGPLYALGIATAAAIVRNILGLGTLLAFPGGMFGALLAGLAFKLFRNRYAAALGEVIGTGVLGSLASAWLVAPLLMGKPMALTVLMIAFTLSTLGGSILALVVLGALEKAGLWHP